MMTDLTGPIVTIFLGVFVVLALVTALLALWVIGEAIRYWRDGDFVGSLLGLFAIPLFAMAALVIYVAVALA